MLIQALRKNSVLAWAIGLMLAALWMASPAFAQAASHPPRPTPTDKVCHICDEGLPTEPMPTQQPAAQLTHLVTAQQPSSGKVIVYFFWGDGCPHCAKEKPLLEKLKQQYPVEVKAFEVWNSPENSEIFAKMAAAFGFEPSGVPTTFIGKGYWIGYNDPIGQEIEAAVKACIDAGCPDAGQGIIPSSRPTSAPVDVVPSATPGAIAALATPSPLARSAPAQSNGFALAGAVMVAMVAALIYAGLVAMRGLQGIHPRSMPAWLEWAIPFQALIGLGVAAYLAYVETQAVPAVCGPVGDCNAVQSSEYARLLGMLPIGVLGAMGYTAILLAWLWGRFRAAPLAEYAPLALFGLTLFGILFSLYLTYLELFVIHAVCAWCLTSAVIMTMLMLLSVGPAMQTADH